MNRIHITAAALLLAGCATHTEMTLPDGSKGYNVSCDGAVLSMGDLLPEGWRALPTRLRRARQGRQRHTVRLRLRASRR